MIWPLISLVSAARALRGRGALSGHFFLGITALAALITIL